MKRAILTELHMAPCRSDSENPRMSDDLSDMTAMRYDVGACRSWAYPARVA